MTEIPRLPFLLSDLSQAGVAPWRLRRLVDSGEIRRIFRGVGIAGDVADTIEVRARAARLVLPAGTVLVDHSAAWMLGVDVAPAGASPTTASLAVARLTPSRAVRREGIDGCRRTIGTSDVVAVEGVPVTSPTRTAADLACRRGRYAAMATLDAFCRQHGVDAESHAPMVARFAGRRGVTQYRELVPLISSRAESPRESWTRLAIIDHGLPCPEQQVDVYVAGLGWVRLDLGYRGRRLGTEYDGADYHGSAEQQERDRARRTALSAAGWMVIVVHADGFREPELSRWTSRLRAAYADRGPSTRRVYARAERAPRRGR